MAGTFDSGHLELAEVFRRVQGEMLSHLSVGCLFEHPASHGTATEQQWLELFDNYLPKRYRATPAFIINAAGNRSRQIDIAIYDNFYSPPLFPHKAGAHIPIESVYAVFEVKSTITRQWLRDAAEKAVSVRELRSDKRPILAGLLATTTGWKQKPFPGNLRRALSALSGLQRLDLGCALDRGSFEFDTKLNVSQPDEALIFLTLRLIDRLNALGPAPPVDLMRYVADLRSFKDRA